MSDAPGSYLVRVAKETFHFCAAHFLLFGDGTREELHGHNYRVAVELEGALQPAGMVVDFIRLKPVVRAVCEELDHRTLLPRAHPALTFRSAEGHLEVRHGADRFVFPLRDVVLLPIDNITAELLARHVGDRLVEELRRRFPECRVTRVEVAVEETTGQWGVHRRTLPGATE